MMKKRYLDFLSALVAAATLAVTSPLSLAEEKSDTGGKVAVVNGSIITRAEFDREMGRVQQGIARQGRAIDNSKLPAIRKEVLEGLIDRELLFQQSRKQGIKVEETAVTDRLGTLKGRFPSEDQFEAALKSMGLTLADLMTQLREGMAIKYLIERRFEEGTSVSDEEAKAYYDGNPKDFMRPEQIQAKHILIKVSPKADKSEKAAARKKIEEIQAKLKKGEDFGALAKEFSEGPSSAKGGDLGWFERGRMVKPFEEAAFALKPGEVSNVVETPFGYHLIEVTDKRPATKMAYADVKEKLQQYLKDIKVQKEVRIYVAELKEKAQVERFL
jgi:peptidyl-prolyl cis-trans isomerase C